MNKLFVFGYNRPDLLEKQYQSFQKNVVGDFEFYLVYDHTDDRYTEQFHQICSTYNIDIYDHQRETNLGNSQNHASSMQWIYDNFLSVDDTVVFLDHDIFLIDKFDIDSYFSKYDIFGTTTDNGVINYFSTMVFGFKFKEIKKFNLSFFPGMYNEQYLDTFGNSHILLENQLLNKKIFNKKYYSEIPDKMFEVFDEKFIHLYGASKWYSNFKFDENDEYRKNSVFNIVNESFLK